MSEWVGIRDEVARRLWRAPAWIAAATLLFFVVAELLRALVAMAWGFESGATSVGGYLGATWLSAGLGIATRWLPFAIGVLLVLRILVPMPADAPVGRLLARSLLAAVAGAVVVILVELGLVLFHQSRPVSVLTTPEALRLDVMPVALVSLGVETLIAGVPVVVMFAILSRLKVPAERG